MIELEEQTSLRIRGTIDKQIGNQLSVPLYMKAIMGLKWDLDEDFYEALMRNVKQSIKYEHDFS
jgi:hypothetical protein